MPESEVLVHCYTYLCISYKYHTVLLLLYAYRFFENIENSVLLKSALTVLAVKVSCTLGEHTQYD